MRLSSETSFSFEKVFAEFNHAEEAAERRHNELMSVIALERGVDPKHLQPLFDAVGHDSNVSPDR